MEEDFLAKLNIRPLTIGDLDAIVEIDRKVLGKARRDYWRKKIEVSRLPGIRCRAWWLKSRERSSGLLSVK